MLYSSLSRIPNMLFFTDIDLDMTVLPALSAGLSSATGEKSGEPRVDLHDPAGNGSLTFVHLAPYCFTIVLALIG